MLLDVLKAYCKRIVVRLGVAKYVQFAKFGVVGISNTVISLCVFWTCHYLLHLHYQIANLIAFIVSVTNAYYWNSKFVFQAQQKAWTAHLIPYAKTFLSYGGTFLLNVGLLQLGVEILHLPAGIVPLCSLVVTVPVNYAFNRFWVFRKRT